MTIRATYSLFCEGGGEKCHGWIGEFQKQPELAQQLRHYARVNGWARRRVDHQLKDFCPYCKNKVDT